MARRPQLRQSNWPSEKNGGGRGSLLEIQSMLTCGSLLISKNLQRETLSRTSERLNRGRHGYQLLYFRSQQIEMAIIPGVEVVRACLERACRNQPVINRSAHNSHPRDAADGGTVLIPIEPNQGKPVFDFLHEQICGFGAEALFPRIPGKRRIHFGEAVSGAGRILRACRRKGSEAARMV